MTNDTGTVQCHVDAMAKIGVTEDLIESLVRTFYAKVRQDPELGPVFEEKIAHDWESHLRTMMDFWSSVVLNSGRYKGNPILKHQMLVNVSSHHFVIWLDLFRTSAEEACPPSVANLFTDHARNIATNLKRQIALSKK